MQPLVVLTIVVDGKLFEKWLQNLIRTDRQDRQI